MKLTFLLTSLFFALLSDAQGASISKSIGSGNFNIPIKVIINNQVYDDLVYLDKKMKFQLSSRENYKFIETILDYINSTEFRLSFRFDCSNFEKESICENYEKLRFSFDFSTTTFSIVGKTSDDKKDTTSLTRINNNITYNKYNNDHNGNYNVDINHGLTDNIYLGADLQFSWSSENANRSEFSNIYVSQRYSDIDLKYSYQKGYNNRYYINKSSSSNYLTIQASKGDKNVNVSQNKSEVIEYSSDSGSINILSSDRTIKSTQPLIRGYNSITLDLKSIGTNTAIVQIIVDGEVIKETQYSVGKGYNENRIFGAFSFSENLDDVLFFGGFTSNDLEYQLSYSTVDNYILNRFQYDLYDFNASYQYIYSDNKKNISEYTLNYRKKFKAYSIGASYFYSEGESVDSKSMNLYYNRKIINEYNFTMSYQRSFNTSEYSNINLSLSGASSSYSGWDWTLTADNNFVTKDRNIFLSFSYNGKKSGFINPTLGYGYGNKRGNEFEVRNKMKLGENDSLNLGLTYEQQSKNVRSDASLYISNDWFNSNIFVNRGNTNNGYGLSLSNSVYVGSSEVWAASKQYDNYVNLDDYSSKNIQINNAPSHEKKVGFDKYFSISTDEQQMKSLENQSGKLSRFRMIDITTPDNLKENYIVYGRVVDKNSKGIIGVDIINHSSRTISGKNGYFAMTVRKTNPTIKLMAGNSCGYYNVQDFLENEQSVVILGRLKCEQ